MWYYRTVAWNKLEESFFPSKLISAFMELQASQQGWCDQVHLPPGKFTSKGQRSNTYLEHLLVLTDTWGLSCPMEPCYLPYSKFSWQDLLFLCHLWGACFSLQHQLVGLGPSDLRSPDSIQGHALYNPCAYRLQWHQSPGSLDSGSSLRLRHLCLACLKHGNDQFFLIKVCFSFLPTESKLPGVGPSWWQSSLVKSDVWRLIITLGW